MEIGHNAASLIQDSEFFQNDSSSVAYRISDYVVENVDESIMMLFDFDGLMDLKIIIHNIYLDSDDLLVID